MYGGKVAQLAPTHQESYHVPPGSHINMGDFRRANVFLEFTANENRRGKAAG